MVEITDPFFSLSGQKQRLKNVGDTFSAIGQNIFQGKFFTSVPASRKFEGSFLGKAAEFLTKPAFIFGAPAAVGAAKVAAPAVAAQAPKALKNATRFAGSRAVRSAAGTGLLIGGGASLIRSTGRTVEKSGAKGLISGSGTTKDTVPQPQTETIFIDPATGQPITLRTKGLQQPNISAGQGRISTQSELSSLLNSNTAKVGLAAAVAVAILAVTKR